MKEKKKTVRSYDKRKGKNSQFTERKKDSSVIAKRAHFHCLSE